MGPYWVEHHRAVLHPACAGAGPLVALGCVRADPREDELDLNFRNELAPWIAYLAANPGKGVGLRFSNGFRSYGFYDRADDKPWREAAAAGVFAPERSAAERDRLAEIEAALRGIGRTLASGLVYVDYEQNPSMTGASPEYVAFVLTDPRVRRLLPVELRGVTPAQAADLADPRWCRWNSLFSGFHLEVIARTLRRDLDLLGLSGAAMCVTHSPATFIPVNGDGPHASATVRLQRFQWANDLFYPTLVGGGEPIEPRDETSWRARAGVVAAAGWAAAMHAKVPWLPTFHGRLATEREIRELSGYAAPRGCVWFLGAADDWTADWAMDNLGRVLAPKAGN